MTKKITAKSEADSLRLKAEALLKTNQHKQTSRLTKVDLQKLIQELQVNQIELELQNEELILAKETAEAANDKSIELFDFAPPGYFKLDKDGKIMDLNLSGAKMLAKERVHLKNSQLAFFIVPGDRAVFNLFSDKVFENKTKQSCEISILSGENTSTNIYFTGIVAENGEYCWLTGVDITERKKSEEVLQENISRLSLVMQTANMAWWEMDISTGNVAFGEKKAEMLGYPSAIFKHYKDFTKLLHPDDYGKVMNAMLAHINGLVKKYEVEYRILTKSGEYKWFYDIGSIVKRTLHGKPHYISGLVFDITERKQADEEIRKSKEQLALLYKHIEQVREEERTIIAREIHDDLGQSLAGLKIDLLGIKEDMHEKVCVCPKQKINKAISMVDATIKKVQKISSELRPLMLDELGLASAIEWQSNEFKKRTGLKCNLELEDIGDLPENIAITMFRIFQASLTNIMLHSKAKTMSVKLLKIAEIIHLTITDDGKGITQAQINSVKSFGIIGMRERTHQINGKFEIRTRENIGTEIIVTVPLKTK